MHKVSSHEKSCEKASPVDYKFWPNIAPEQKIDSITSIIRLGCPKKDTFFEIFSMKDIDY